MPDNQARKPFLGKTKKSQFRSYEGLHKLKKIFFRKIGESFEENFSDLENIIIVRSLQFSNFRLQGLVNNDVKHILHIGIQVLCDGFSLVDGFGSRSNRADVSTESSAGNVHLEDDGCDSVQASAQRFDQEPKLPAYTHGYTAKQMI